MAPAEPTQPDPCLKPRPARAWLIGVLLCAVLLMGITPYHCPDVWNHVTFGRHALRHGPTQIDPFSCTGRMLELPFIQFEWVFQILTYLSHTHLGVTGTIMAKALLCVAAFALLALACRERGAGWGSTTLAVALAALAASPRFMVRPDVVSFVAFGFVLWALERARNGRPALLWLLPLAFVLWVNMHGAFLAGWALMGLAYGGAFLQRGAVDARKSRIRMLFGIVFVLCVAAAFVNPYGVHIFLVPFKLTQTTMIRKAIRELGY